jgi:peptidoglycan-N-acetylglucosamine deacetylase
MRNAVAAFCLMAAVVGLEPAAAAECPGNPDALGVSRTISIDPTEHRHLGALQYHESLPLKDREIVLTFDDGPLPPYSNRVLDILASECVKATYFMVGRMARSFPQLVRRAYEEGHTIANHSQNHPLRFHKFTVDQASREIEDGFASIRGALEEQGTVADFFRIPGLLRQSSVEEYLDSRGVMTWSVDLVADDWKHIPSHEVVKRALARIEARGRGILLLHDIQPATAQGLPDLLRELKLRGYKIVHVVQASSAFPKTVTDFEQWALRQPTGQWPRVVVANFVLPAPVLPAPSLQSFAVGFRPGAMVPATLVPGTGMLRTAGGNVPAAALWARGVVITALPLAAQLPAPAAELFHYARVFKQRTVVRVARAVATAPGPRNPIAQPNARPATPRDPAQPIRPRTTVPSAPSGHQIQLPRPTAGLRNSSPAELR